MGQKGIEKESWMGSTWEMRRMGEEEKGGEERNGTVTGRGGEWDSRWENRNSGTVGEERSTVGQEEGEQDSGSVGDEKRIVGQEESETEGRGEGGEWDLRGVEERGGAVGGRGREGDGQYV